MLKEKLNRGVVMFVDRASIGTDASKANMNTKAAKRFPHKSIKITLHM
jgi:hypothetical protein